MSVIPDVYTILIVDDELDVHAMTRLALKSLVYKERPVKIVFASSGQEALKHMRKNPETAIILMDVVMESDIAGLETCRQIREELNNDTVRIILRTGQPGQAPEKKIIETYEIDGYLSKAELTITRLFTAVRTALKAYTEIKTVQWLENMLTFLHLSSSNLQFSDTLTETLDEVLMITQEIVPTDWAAIHLNFTQEVEGRTCYTLFNGLELVDKEQPEIVVQLIREVNSDLQKSPLKKYQPYKTGCLFPIPIPPEIGFGWLYLSQLQLNNHLAESAVIKAIEMLLHQTNNALYNTIIKDQAEDIESFMGI